MRFRSTGFGDREIKGHMEDLSTKGQDLLVMSIQTTDPVKWHMRAGLQFSDVAVLLKGISRPSVLWLILRSLLFVKKDPKEPEDF